MLAVNNQKEPGKKELLKANTRYGGETSLAQLMQQIVNTGNGLY